MVEDEVEKWKYLIGSTILRFGEIELATYQLWVYYGYQPKEAPTEFKKRCDKVIGLVARDSQLSEQAKDSLRQLLIRSKQLSDMRNDVAHNPIQVNIYKHPESETLIEQVEINHVLENKIISYQDLANFLKELQEVAEKIYEIIPQPLMKVSADDI